MDSMFELTQYFLSVNTIRGSEAAFGEVAAFVQDLAILHQ